MNDSRRPITRTISLAYFSSGFPFNLVLLALICLCLAILSSSTAAAENDVAIESKLSVENANAHYVKLKRAAIWVADLDRAIVFYRDVLGFSLNTVSNIELKDDSVLFDMYNADPSQQIRRALFSSSTEERALFVMETPAAPEYVIDSKRHSSLVLESKDLQAVEARAAKHGFKIGAKNIDALESNGTEFRETVIIGPGGQTVLVYHLSLEDGTAKPRP